MTVIRAHGFSHLPARFRAKVSLQLDSCWVWTGQRNWKGYGVFWFQGAKVKAHRFAYEYLVDPIPDGLTIDHLCRVRRCVNPKHMEPVTVHENLMRGEGWGALNAAKTTCKNGHELIPENTYVRPDGRGRECRACHRIWSKHYRKATGRAATRPASLTGPSPDASQATKGMDRSACPP